MRNINWGLLVSDLLHALAFYGAVLAFWFAIGWLVARYVT